ncbi:sugar phosphate nucleotidyltransferase [Flavobacteriaceae bacterium]|nr:sugar phosphate nucleotidyltransferase [Flavobacteriaceae bacterium]
MSFDQKSVKSVEKKSKKAIVFGYCLNDLESYEFLKFNVNKYVTSTEEKSIKSKSNCAVFGLNFCTDFVVKIPKITKSSIRSEFEITTINTIYLDNNELNFKLLLSGYTCLDTGIPDSLLEASNSIQTIENLKAKKVACFEEITFDKGYINSFELNKSTKYLFY